MPTVTSSLHLQKLKPSEDIAFDRDVIIAGLFGEQKYKAWISAVHIYVPSTRDKREEVVVHNFHSYASEDAIRNGTPIQTDLFLTWDGFDVCMKFQLAFVWSEDFKSFKLTASAPKLSSINKPKSESYYAVHQGIGAAIDLYFDKYVRVVGYDLSFEPIIPSPVEN